MKCRLVIGANFYDLAGANGVASETQGLSVNYDVTSEQVAYIGATEARQFWRPGSSVRATFSSQVTFSSVADAEAEIGLLYGFLKNQEGAVAYLGDIADDGSVQIETATASGTAGTEVTVTESTSGSTIYYTTDGSTPTTGSSTVSSGAKIIVPTPATLKLLAVKSGSTNSPIKSTSYIATGTVPEAIVSPDSSAQSADTVTVTVSSVISGATLHYTTNGVDPTTGSATVISGSTVSVPVPGTLKVLAVKSGLTDSPIKVASYVSQFSSGTPIATGGDEIGTYTDGGTTYKYHKFTSAGNFVVTRGGTVDILMIGGGGAGGGVVSNYNGGGGGAGEVKEVTSEALTAGTYAIAIGAGGISSTSSPAPSTTDGGDTDFNSGAYTAIGGGGGAVGLNTNGRNGASGGGGAPTTGLGGTGSAGNNGGNGNTSDRAGGGGGAGAAGGTQSGATADLAGASGLSYNYDGSSIEYGQGGRVDNVITGALTPGSGGAGRWGSGTSLGQDGANGILIIRYAEPVDNDYVAPPTLSPDGGNVASGNVEVTLTRNSVDSVYNVPILAGEAVGTWAEKIRDYLSNTADVNFGYTVSGTGGSIILTSRRNQADASLNIAIDNGSPSPGITPAPTSTNTQAGAEDTVTPILTIYDAITQVGVAYRGRTLSISSSIIGRTENPSP